MKSVLQATGGAQAGRGCPHPDDRAEESHAPVDWHVFWGIDSLATVIIGESCDKRKAR